MNEIQTHHKLANPDICTGCAACANVCPKGCISMIEDHEGFLQPKIEAKSCIACHKCEKICPIIKAQTISNEFETKAYAIINLDEDVRMLSSSGGVFYALAKWVIEQGGVVFGARWDENWEVMHDYAEDMEGVKAFMQSKYVQSRVGDTYRQVKEFLKQDRWVLYSGTPCQLGGLRAFLGKEYERLLQVDIVCHGVPSPGVWRKYLKEKVKGDKILGLSFRDKLNGKGECQCVTTVTTQRTFIEHQNENLFYRGFIGKVYLRFSCYNCHYKTLHRDTDITLADYWGVRDICPEMDDNKGTSLVFVHSSKGDLILNQIKDDLRYREQHLPEAIEWNQAMIHSVPLSLRRKDFFRVWKWLPFHKMAHWIDKDRLTVRIGRKLEKWIKK